MTPLEEKYADLNAAAGFLGNAVSPVLQTPNGLGSYQHYEGGSIYWKHELPVAFEVHGLIRAKWADLGWENSFLGFPISDETDAGGGRGRVNVFEYGLIAWRPVEGSFEVHGAIFHRYLQLGAVDGRFGFPLTDETGTPDGRGRYNHFERGSIYWTAQTAAHDVTDIIKPAWANTGWELGPLGYPIAAEGSMPGSPVSFQDFENGSLYVLGTALRVVLRNQSIFATGGQIIGWGAFGTLLPGGDIVSATFVGRLPGAACTLTLNAGPGIAWWKAVALWSPVRGTLFEVTTENQRTTESVVLPAADIEAPDVFLQFKKAGFLGVRTVMYTLPRVDRLVGNDVTFTWTRD